MSTEREILIVEDDADLREVLASVLEGHGYVTRTAAHGAEALQALQQGARPALILLDLMMPVMNGRELLDHLAEDAELSAIPVVLLSAHSDMRAEITRGTVGTVSKPVALRDLLDVLRRHLR